MGKVGIYILQFDNGIKIGKSSDIQTRIENYKSPWVRAIQRSFFFEVRNCDQLEREIKVHFQENIVTKGSSEFITDIDFDEVKAFVVTCIAIEQGIYFHPKKRKSKKKDKSRFLPAGIPDWCK